MLSLCSSLLSPNLRITSFNFAARFCSSIESEYKAEIDDVNAANDERLKRRGALMGTVTSVKCAKSVSVMVYHDKYFSKYNKTIRRRKKIMAHDENESANLGDFVRIVPSRAYSRKKHHLMIDVLRKANILDLSADKVALIKSAASDIQKENGVIV